MSDEEASFFIIEFRTIDRKASCSSVVHEVTALSAVSFGYSMKVSPFVAVLVLVVPYTQ